MVALELTIVVIYDQLERCPSGLRSTLGKRVCGQPYLGFESPSLRQIKYSRIGLFLFSSCADVCYIIDISISGEEENGFAK